MRTARAWVVSVLTGLGHLRECPLGGGAGTLRESIRNEEIRTVRLHFTSFLNTNSD